MLLSPWKGASAHADSFPGRPSSPSPGHSHCSVADQIMAIQRYQDQIPGKCKCCFLRKKRSLQMWFRILRCRNYPGWSTWALNAIACILIPEAEGDLTQTEEERATWRQKKTLEWSGPKPRNMAATRSWTRQRVDSPLEPPEKTLPWWLISVQRNSFQTSGLQDWERINLCCLSHEGSGSLLLQPTEADTDSLTCCWASPWGHGVTITLLPTLGQGSCHRAPFTLRLISCSVLVTTDLTFPLSPTSCEFPEDKGCALTSQSVPRTWKALTKHWLWPNRTTRVVWQCSNGCHRKWSAPLCRQQPGQNTVKHRSRESFLE